MTMSIYPVRAGADAQWQVLATSKGDAVAGLGDEAFTRLESFRRPPAVAVLVRSDNVVATVRLAVPSAGTEQRLAERRPAAADITADVLDDLR